MYALIFLMIFGFCLLLAAGWLAILKDPRNSVFLYRVYGLKKMSLEKAREIAKKIATIVAIIGGIIMVLCGIGLLVILLLPS